ncbi:MAG: hypothetical protein GXO75_16160 [Calditrichaeota bacterium]|nr:hypothetical protein [Calditrichota bacterium]
MKTFFKYAFLQNRWLWFHILAGGALAKISLQYLLARDAVAVVVALAIFWEIMESLRPDIEKIYGSYLRFFYDAVGDIVGAVAMALIVII